MASYLQAILMETEGLTQDWRARLPPPSSQAKRSGSGSDGGTSSKGGSKGGSKGVSSGRGVTLDVYREARRLTLEVVLRVSFGLSDDFEKADELSDVIGR